MRQIKFRAWHKELKVMASMPEYFEDFVFLDGDGNRVASDCDIGSAIWADYIELMQFTGLKDCNGVDIYEGDIVEDEDYYYSVISWDNNDSMYIASDVGGVADLNFPVKVIGNIHQNPELIEA